MCKLKDLYKNILKHQQFVESRSEYVLEPIQFPSLVLTFAVIPSLVLMRTQNSS